MNEPSGGNSRLEIEIKVPAGRKTINVQDPDDMLEFCKAMQADMRDLRFSRDGFFTWCLGLTLCVVILGVLLLAWAR